MCVYAGKYLYETVVHRLLTIKVFPEMELSQKMGSSTSSWDIFVAFIFQGLLEKILILGVYFL